MTDMLTTPEFDQLLRALKLSGIKHTLLERLALAKQRNLSHASFLELVLADEHARRENVSAGQRAYKAGLDPSLRVETWQELDDVSYDRELWSDLIGGGWIHNRSNVLVLGPVGVGKTHLATALGHIAIRRRIPTLFVRADRLFHRLKAARLDNTVEAEHRRLAVVKLLVIDDFALRGMDGTQTSDFYELIVERHQRWPTIITSNRDPSEWIGQMADTLLAQAAIDRVTAGAHILVVDGPSYRQRTKGSADRFLDNQDGTNHAR